MHELSFLVLENGTVFEGLGFGYPAPRVSELDSSGILEKSAGELVFNTGMTGYHEILTDPSYTGQIVTMTYPLIGNYGTSGDWDETLPDKGQGYPVRAAGFVVRTLYEGPITEKRVTLDGFLKENLVPGIQEVDTRAVTLHIRKHGSPRSVIVRPDKSGARSLSQKEIDACVDYLQKFPVMEGRNLADSAGVTSPKVLNDEGSTHMLVVDSGVKANIVRELQKRNCRVTLIPPKMGPEAILQFGADGILYSNGPGDPAVLNKLIKDIEALIGKMPVFGICLGHQLISLALGAKSYKMKFGHHGINNPVRDEFTGKVFVTSQNHGFAVHTDSLPDNVDVWFNNANDGTLEGIYHKELPLATAQFHPEAAPGPEDSSWIFDAFLKRIHS